MFPPDPPPNQALLALLAAALSQAHPSMAGTPVPQSPGAGAAYPMLGGGDVMTPPPTQGQGHAMSEGPLGENAHLGWGTAPPMDYHTALASAAPKPRRAMPKPDAAPRPTRRGTSDFQRLRSRPINYRVSGRY